MVLLNKLLPSIRLNVSLRIIGGYILVLLLVAALLVTGMLGINKINLSLNGVTQKAMPMLSYAGGITSTMLQGRLGLNRFYNSQSTKQMDLIERLYTIQKEENLEYYELLHVLVQDNEVLKETLDLVKNSQDKMYEADTQLIKLHRDSVKSAITVQEQAFLFSDMADEMLSYSNDLSRISDDEYVKTKIYDLEVELDELSTTALAATESRIADEVRGIDSDLKSGFKEMENQLGIIGKEPFISGSKELANLNEAYGNYKNSIQQLLQSQINVLRLAKEAAGKLKAANSAGNESIEILNELSGYIGDYVDEIESISQDSVSTSRNLLIIIAVIALITSLLIGILTTQSIRKPLNNTVDVIKQVATGDLTQKFNSKSNDELGVLGKNMQNLVDQLRKMMQDIGDNSEALASTAEQSAAISEQSLEGIEQQREQTELITTAMKEMATTVNEVSKSTSQTMIQVENVHIEAHDGQSALNQSIQSITKLSEDINHGAEVINKLNAKSNNIGSVLDVIKNIAEQTNLLALNAAIEAARAGEQGRGFAVVADEVRTLASRTDESTAEIQTMIEELQRDAGEAVNTMNFSRDEAQTSVEGIRKVEDILGSVVNSMTSIKDMSIQVANATEEQSSTTQEQLSNLTAIAEVAVQSANGAEENKNASIELARMAEALQTLVNQFKV